MKRIAIAAILALIFAASLSAQDYKGDVQKGKKLYMDVGCYECHGTVAQGGSAGPSLAPTAVPWEPLSLYYRAYLRHPAGVMPPYTEKVLTDVQLTDIFAYLQTMPQPAKDIPLLK